MRHFLRSAALLPILSLVAPACLPAVGEAPAVPDPELFPVSASLEPAVEFWTKVYSRWGSDHVLIHDDRHLDILYAVLDFSELEGSAISAVRKELIRRTEIRNAKERIERLLGDLAAGRQRDGAEEEQRRIEILFRDVPGGREKFAAARERIRHQTCLRDRFEEAVRISGRYLPHMERIFASMGLPTELTRLPFVESMFQSHARSKVAAAGMWQFMPATARSYLRVDLEVDERFDPLHATLGAARLLADNQKALDSWPLAVTAYNHGRYGMVRAVRQLGTRDLGKIVDGYKSRSFGFASRNFYAEFVAAARVAADRERHFPGVEPDPPLDFAELTPELYVRLPALALAAGADLDTLRALNPGLEDQVWSGDLLFPGDYRLRVPSQQLDAFEVAYRDLDGEHTSRHQTVRFYTVRQGDSLGSIATRFGTSIRRLQEVNKIRDPHRIRVGQRLVIPPEGSSAPAPTARAAATPGSHDVRPGESLSAISARYGVSLEELQRLNGLASPDHIVPGQRLDLPGAGGARVHVVRRGESLGSIARRYGTSVRALRSANGLSGSVIHPGQELRIP